VCTSVCSVGATTARKGCATEAASVTHGATLAFMSGHYVVSAYRFAFHRENDHQQRALTRSIQSDVMGPSGVGLDCRRLPRWKTGSVVRGHKATIALLTKDTPSRYDKAAMAFCNPM
jgi:hypothetical protein